ncbi:MAG: PcfK-like family protein [Lachnospiraceae bacterium]|nr:PcfK-like family protein [Lachnospiraceae bacterium]MDE7201115.1 PcfK-like family protein [Lachnospiraceae bacterium]
MISDYKAQIDQILKNTEKEEANNTSDKIAAVATYKIMIGAISKFIEKESCSNPEFDAALSLEWKSAGRMLKHIWSNAEKMALRHGQIASCCLTEEVVYAWAREYYFLDDREAVMKERAEKAKAEQKQKEAKEKESQYEKRALDILSKQSGWDDLSDEEKKKKIASKIKSLKTSDSRKSNKSTAKSSAVSPAIDEKEDAAPGESQDQDNSSEICVTEASVELEMELANTLDGQMNLFTLLQGGE